MVSLPAIENDVKEVAEDALYIFAGALVGRVLLKVVGKFAPQVNAYAPYAMLLLGAVGASMTRGIVRKLMIGAGIAGGLQVADMLLTPVLAPIEAQASAIVQ